MATYVDGANKTWTFDDGKMNFTAWLESDSERKHNWESAGAEFDRLKLTTGDIDHSAAKIFSQWVSYANAQ